MRPEGPSQDRLRIAAVCEEAKKASVHPATAAIARCIAARTETETVSRHSLNCRPRRRAVESHVYMRINRGVSGIYAYIMIGGVFFFFQTKPNQMRGKGGEREPRRACVYIYVGCTGHDGCGYAGWLEGVRVASILYHGVWEMCADGAEGSRRLPRSRWPEHDEHAYTVRPHGHAPRAYTRPPSSRLSVCTACTCDFEMNVRLLPRGSAPLGLARGGGHALTGVER